MSLFLNYAIFAITGTFAGRVSASMLAAMATATAAEALHSGPSKL